MIYNPNQPPCSVIDDDSDLTIALITRYWIHATGEEEIVQLFIFLMMLVPRRPVPGLPNRLPLYFVAEGEPDTTVTILRRILRSNNTIAEFLRATGSHLRRFRGFEAMNVAAILEKLWSWAQAFRYDSLCSEFLRVIRTSAPLWSSLFEASSRCTGKHHSGSFADTPHFYVGKLAAHLVLSRDSSSEAMALTELMVSTGVFNALEASLGEALLYGTEDEQIELCSASSRTQMSSDIYLEFIIFVEDLARIYYGISYGPPRSPSFKSLMHQQLPRPRTIGLLWDISRKFSGSDIKRIAPSHACRVAVMALEMLFSRLNTCKRRGCEETSTARCTRCRLEYCGITCQKRYAGCHSKQENYLSSPSDWKDHKMVCSITMDMEPAVSDETQRLSLSWMGH
jgi:hypothetical protein